MNEQPNNEQNDKSQETEEEVEEERAAHNRMMDAVVTAAWEQEEIDMGKQPNTEGEN